MSHPFYPCSLIEKYTCGNCYHLAAALLILRPQWLLACHTDTGHAWVELTDGRKLDVEGIRSAEPEDRETNYFTTVDEFFAWLRDGEADELDQEEIEEALPVARQLLTTYTL